MWNWLTCYLSGRHDFAPSCEPGAMFLHCMHCGKRSAGWSIDAKPQSAVVPPASAKASAAGLRVVAS